MIMFTMIDPLETLTPAWVRTFLAVARHRNYTRAAEELYVTQSAVSRQMLALQRSVGIPLVEQLGKAIELTDAGRAVLREAERIQAGVTRTSETLTAIHGGREGRLRIGASTTPGFYILPPVLGSFVKKRPSLDLTYTVDNTLKIEEALLRNELDLGFVGGHLATGELTTEPLVADEVVIYSSRTHPIARLKRASPERLVEHTFIVRERGSATRELFESWLKKRGLELTKTIELHCPEAIKTLVAAGVGLAISSCHGLSREGKRFKQLSVPGLEIERTILLARHREKQLSPLHQEFLAAIRYATRPCEG
jgi:DNA-binding transcriptional LysR family regulator